MTNMVLNQHFLKLLRLCQVVRIYIQTGFVHAFVVIM